MKTDILIRRICNTCLAAALAMTPAAWSADSIPAGVRSIMNLRHIPESSLSLYVENLDTGEELATWGAEQPRSPASVAKLLTTLVALDTLGPTYTWKTEAYTLGDIEGDVLDGDLLLKGYGDPFLVTERLWQMLRELRRAGIRRIDGKLRIDDSVFDVGDYDPAAFDREPLRAYNVAPNALLTNFKVVRYRFEPDPGTSGVNVTLDPSITNLEVVNRISLVNGRCRGYQRGVSITPSEDYSRMVFGGSFPSGCRRYAMDRTALGHNAFTYGVFKVVWEESGGEIAGGWENAVVPAELEPFLVFKSLPLAEIITKVNKHSNNVMARQLLFTLSAEVLGAPGTEPGGRDVVRQWLADRNLDFAELKLDNGAGLSRESRMTARHLGQMLRYGYESPYMPEYLSSLSLSGLDGTLSRRMRGSALIGKGHLKTGSLDHVSSLAGYFQSRGGERFVIVVMLNHQDVHRGPGEEVQEALLRWVHEQ